MNFSCILLLFFSSLFSPTNCLIQIPHVNSICSGLNQTGDNVTPGGQFGYSISLSNGKDYGKSWLAIGKPWDSSVHLYSIDNPINPSVSSSFQANCIDSVTLAFHSIYCNSSYYYNYPSTSYPQVILPSNSSINYPITLQNCTFTSTNQPLIAPCQILDPWIAKLSPSILWKFNSSNWSPPSNISWKPYQGLTDPISQNWNTAGYSSTGYVKQWSLFGFSISFSQDSRRLAIGIPSRGTVPGTSSLLDSPYHSGAVRLYRRDDTLNKFISLQDELRLSNSSLIPQPFDSFGTQVLFSKDPSSTFLFVASSGGTDGWMCGPGTVATDGMNTTLACFGIPLQNTTNYNLNSTRLSSNVNGIYQGGDVSRIGVFVYKLNVTIGKYSFHQFVPTTSPVSLGVNGMVISTGGFTTDSIFFTMREWLINPPTPLAARYWNYTTGFNTISIHRYNSTLNKFIKDIPLENDAITSVRFGGGGDWKDDDWFGKFHVNLQSWSSIYSNSSYPLPPDPITGYFDQPDLETMIISSPRRNDRVVVVEKMLNDTKWSLRQELKRQDVVGKRGYWGGSLSVDSRFLLIGDALSDSGKGSIHLYYRQLYDTESLIPPFEGGKKGEWIRIGKLIKPNNSTMIGSTTSTGYAQGNWKDFNPDHFGSNVVMNDWFIVAGTGVEGCVWTFFKPGVYNLLPQPIYPLPPNNTVINGTVNGNVTLPTKIPDVPPPMVELPPLPPSIPLDTIIIPLPTEPPVEILNYTRTTQGNFSLPTPPAPTSISIPSVIPTSIYIPSQILNVTFSTLDNGWILPTPPPPPTLTYEPPKETMIELPTPPSQPTFNITMVNVTRPVLNDTRIYPNMTGWKERQEVEARKEVEVKTNNAIWIGIGAGIGSLIVLLPPSIYGLIKVHKMRMLKKWKKEREDMLLKAGIDPNDINDLQEVAPGGSDVDTTKGFQGDSTVQTS